MGQIFHASESDTFTWNNGAVGHRPGGPFDVLGPYAKVRNCPIDGFPGVRLTCYATGYADSFFSVPACTRYKGKSVSGFFTTRDDGIVFVPFKKYHAMLSDPIRATNSAWIRSEKAV